MGAYRSNRWFYVTAGERKSFVHSSWVKNQVQVPPCSTYRGIIASSWAAEQINETKPELAEARAVGIPGDQWSGYCASLSYLSYLNGTNYRPRFAGNAKPRYNQYQQAGLVRPWSSSAGVQIGSMIFWPQSTEWGHTAIYVGNDYVVSTMGVFDGQANKRVPVGQFGRPAGWVAPADV